MEFCIFINYKLKQKWFILKKIGNCVIFCSFKTKFNNIIFISDNRLNKIKVCIFSNLKDGSQNGRKRLENSYLKKINMIFKKKREQFLLKILIISLAMLYFFYNITDENSTNPISELGLY